MIATSWYFLSSAGASLSATGGCLVLRMSALFETHVLEAGNSAFVWSDAVRLRECRGALRADFLVHLFVKSQMRVRHDSGQDRLGIGVADFAPDPLADRINPLRSVRAGLGDFGARYGGERGL